MTIRSTMHREAAPEEMPQLKPSWRLKVIHRFFGLIPSTRTLYRIRPAAWGADMQPRAHPTSTHENATRLPPQCTSADHYATISTCAGLIALYLPLLAVISNACGTDSMPDNTCLIVGSMLIRPEATSRTVCSRWAWVLMSGKT